MVRRTLQNNFPQRVLICIFLHSFFIPQTDKFGAVALKEQINLSDRAVAVLGHDQLRGMDGFDAITKSYVYSNVKPDAEDEKLMAVGKALGSLFDNDMTGLVVVERAELMED